MPATAGLNWLLFTPCPLKIPPAGIPPCKVNGEAVIQTGVTVSIETTGNKFTVTAIVTATAHCPSVGVNK